MGPGDFFGEGGVVSEQPRGASVRAVTPIKVCKPTHEDMYVFFESLSLLMTFAGIQVAAMDSLLFDDERRCVK